MLGASFDGTSVAENKNRYRGTNIYNPPFVITGRMIAARDLRKEYGDFVAVEGSTFDVEDGEVFGIVGPNGAGKTTTLKMIAGLVEPTGGEVSVAGYDAGETEMRRRLGFLPEESPLYEEMTPLCTTYRAASPTVGSTRRSTDWTWNTVTDPSATCPRA